MIGFSPQRRAAILAEHPETTEADLDRYVELLARRMSLRRAPDLGYGATGAPDLEGTRLDGEISELQRTLFPRITQALAKVGTPKDA